MRAHPLPDIIVSTTTQLCAEETKSQLCAANYSTTGWGWGRKEDLSARFVYLHNVHIPIMTDLPTQYH